MATLRQPAFDTSPVAVRKARAEDAPVCGRICYEAFTKISTEHAFPPDFPSVEVAAGVLSMMFAHPGFYCVVAESGGQIFREQLPRRTLCDCGRRADYHRSRGPE